MIIGVDVRPLTEKHLTGVGIYLRETLIKMIELDPAVTYKLFFNSWKKPAAQKILELFGRYPNVSLHGTKWPSKITNLLCLFFRRPYLDHLVGGCDWFWFSNLNFWSISKKCKTLLTIHDLSYELIPWSYSLKMRLWHKIVNPRAKIISSDFILAVSQSTKNDLIELYQISESKIKVIYPGISLINKIIDSGEFKVKYGLPKKYLLFLGTVESRKNLEGIINALAKLDEPEVNLVIAGKKGWLFRKIYHLVKSRNLEAKVLFLNYVAQADKFQLYREAQLFLWPSFYEGFGFPILEAMSAGCPVITSANSSLPEISGGAALLADPYNIEDIVFAIKNLLKDDILRSKMVQRGFEQSSKFDFKTTAEKILALIKHD